MQADLPRRAVVLVNADFEARRDEPESDGPRAYEADAAVLDTAAQVRAAIEGLGIEVYEQRVTNTLAGLAFELRQRPVDVVFNLVESIDNDYGREWQVPVWLERQRLPYTGNGAQPLRWCRQKDKARKVLADAGVRVASGFAVAKAASLPSRRLVTLRFPLFVKPARVDGSIGVDKDSIVRDERALLERLAWLEQTLPGPYLVEDYLPGREFNVAIFPAPATGLVVPTEIDFSPCAGDVPPILTYDSKWNPASPEYASKSVPAVLAPELLAEVESIARRAFLALGGTAYGRVDLRLDGEGRPCVIDVNPNNDIHPDAGLAVSARSVGWDYPRLIRAVLTHAYVGPKAEACTSALSRATGLGEGTTPPAVRHRE